MENILEDSLEETKELYNEESDQIDSGISSLEDSISEDSFSDSNKMDVDENAEFMPPSLHEYYPKNNLSTTNYSALELFYLFIDSNIILKICK